MSINNCCRDFPCGSVVKNLLFLFHMCLGLSHTALEGKPGREGVAGAPLRGAASPARGRICLASLSKNTSEIWSCCIAGLELRTTFVGELLTVDAASATEQVLRLPLLL